jgi:glutaredoxin 3
MNIEIYTKSNCPHCTQAKALLDSRSLPYSVISLAERGETGEQYVTREELLNRFPGARTMPQIKIDGVAIGGLTELKAYLQI